MRTPAFWYAEAGALAHVLSPLGALYGTATATRMSRCGALLPAPTITVGNFVAGGAGKTPVALALGRILQEAGLAPAFVSRGYGGDAALAGALRVDRQSAAEVGDEPLLLARVAPTFVGADRLASARLAVAQAKPGALVLDDGLQSRAVEPDLALAVVDGASGIGNGYCLPAGPLRAPLDRQFAHVQAVVVLGAGAPGERVAERARRAGIPVFAAQVAPEPEALALTGRRVVVFAGIARPEKFFATLEGVGATIVARRGFADHHFFGAGEIDALRALAASENAALVTTEKDHVRLPEDMRAGVTPVAIRVVFEAGFREFALARIAARAG
ncbi:MAG: tetraacyldisaccharide 4'-kinase [Beijerinckiaceae bacterium]